MATLIGSAIASLAASAGVAGATGATATAFTVAGTAVTYAQIGGAVLTAGLIGAQFALAPRQQTSAGGTASRALKQAAGPLVFINGRWLAGGTYHLDESTGVKGTYMAGLIVCGGPIDGIEKVYVDDRESTFDEGTHSPETYYLLSHTSGYQFGFEYTLGTTTGYVSTKALEIFPALWDSNHLCKGLVAVYGTFGHYAEVQSSAYPQAFPVLRSLVRGSLHYDPREVGHDIDDDWNAPSTWEWTDNGILHAASYLRHPLGPLKESSDDIDWTAFAAVADKMDVLVDGWNGAQEKFATCHGPWNTEEPARTVLNRIEMACDVQFYEDHLGRWSVRANEWVEPAVTFTDDDIVAVRSQSEQDRAEAINRFVVTFSDPNNHYQPSVSFNVDDTASQAAIGIRSQPLHFEAVTNKNQAFRMATRMLRRMSGRETHQVILRTRGLMAAYQSVVRITSTVFELSGVFRIESADMDGPVVVLKVRETVEADFAAVTIPDDPDAYGTIGNAEQGVFVDQFAQTLNADSGVSASQTFVVSINPSETSAADGNKIRVTFEAASGDDLDILSAWVGHAAVIGDNYDFDGGQVQLLVGGNGAFSVAAGEEQVTDEVDFVYNPTQILLIAFATDTGVTSLRSFSYGSGVDNWSKAGNDAATTDKTGYSSGSTSVLAFNRIEVSL